MPSLPFTRFTGFTGFPGRFTGLQLGAGRGVAARIKAPPEVPGRGGTLRAWRALLPEQLLLGTVLVAMAGGGSAWAQGQGPAAAAKGEAAAQGKAPAAAAVKIDTTEQGKAPAAAAVKVEAAAPGKAAAAVKVEAAAPGKAAAAAKGEPAKAKDAGGALPDAFANLPVAPTAKVAAPTSFDELLKEAVPVKDLATLIEPLYAKCDDGDALLRRQCEGTRGYLLDYLKSHTFVADSDVQPETTPYDTVAKQVDMEVAGCVACKYPPTVAGEPRYVTTRPPQRVAEGRAIVQLVASHEISLPDRTGADRFVERVVPRLRVQHVFRFGTPYGETAAPAKTAGVVGKAAAAPLAAVAAAKGVLIVPLGHRVFDRCTGQIAAASPEQAMPVRVTPDRSCPPKGSEELSQAELKRAEEFAALPERLLPNQIDQVLAPIQAKIHECYVEFGEPSGTAKVAITIGGGGKLTAISLASPFDKADIGVCMRSQLKTAVFPKFRGAAMNVDYVYQVN